MTVSNEEAKQTTAAVESRLQTKVVSFLAKLMKEDPNLGATIRGLLFLYNGNDMDAAAKVVYQWTIEDNPGNVKVKLLLDVLGELEVLTSSHVEGFFDCDMLPFHPQLWIWLLDILMACLNNEVYSKGAPVQSITESIMRVNWIAQGNFYDGGGYYHCIYKLEEK